MPPGSWSTEDTNARSVSILTSCRKRNNMGKPAVAQYLLFLPKMLHFTLSVTPDNEAAQVNLNRRGPHGGHLERTARRPEAIRGPPGLLGARLAARSIPPT